VNVSATDAWARVQEKSPGRLENRRGSMGLLTSNF
jgi:hypothetical protein